MQVTETLSEGLKRGFTIVVPAADIETRRTARLTDLGRTLRLPGFRPGKVPLPVVRQRYGARGDRRGAGGIGQPTRPSRC